MRYWFDTEFIEDGKTIDLISIGVVSEDGRTYYAESGDCIRVRANDWVVENVFPHLEGNYKSRAQIAIDLVAFFGHKPEVWAYYADYDWVVLCQLFGRMIDLPKGWPMYCRDLKQLADEHDIRLPPKQGPEHHALADALWVRTAWEFARQTVIDRLPVEVPRRTTVEMRAMMDEPITGRMTSKTPNTEEIDKL